MECKYLAGCPFFQDRMAAMPALATMYKKRYCQEAPASCARLMVRNALGKEHVPLDLVPNQHDRATAIVEAHARR